MSVECLVGPIKQLEKMYLRAAFAVKWLFHIPFRARVEERH